MTGGILLRFGFQNKIKNNNATQVGWFDFFLTSTFPCKNSLEQVLHSDLVSHCFEGILQMTSQTFSCDLYEAPNLNIFSKWQGLGSPHMDSWLNRQKKLHLCVM